MPFESRQQVERRRDEQEEQEQWKQIDKVR